MTPKEKAIYLCDLFEPESLGQMIEAKSCAKKTCIEILNANITWHEESIPYKYWKEVLQEIDNAYKPLYKQ